MNDDDERRVLIKLGEMERKGSTVLEKLTKVFNPRGSVDAKRLLQEAKADQRYKRLKRNSRIIIQITRENGAVLPPLILHPEAQWRAYWDIFMLLLVCYYALVTPINICFTNSPFDILLLEIIFNLFFIADIVLQFFTSDKHEKGPNAGRLETRHHVIIKNYLKSWFIIDFLASFPLDIIMKQTTGNSHGVNDLIS